MWTLVPLSSGYSVNRSAAPSSRRTALNEVGCRVKEAARYRLSNAEDRSHGKTSHGRRPRGEETSAPSSCAPAALR
jgi:hypothetical protein